MWVRRAQWENVHERLNLRRDETDRLRDCVTILERRLEAVEKAAAGGEEDLTALRQRVAKLEKQVLPAPGILISPMLDRIYNIGVTASTPVTLLQKVNLLLDHLKLRVQPEGTTPAALVKTKGAR